MIDAYFPPSYFKKISVPTPAHCCDTAHIVASIPRKNTQPPFFWKAYFSLRSGRRSSSLFNKYVVSLGFNPHSETRLSEQDSSKHDMDLSSHALKPDWWEGDFQEIFCEIEPNAASVSQRPSTPFYS